MKNFNLILVVIVLNFLVNCGSKESILEVINSSEVIQFSLNVSSSPGGSVSTTGGSYDEGTQISLTAIPDNEYVFNGWSNGSSENPLTVVINQNITLTANFTKRKYPLTINIQGEGVVLEEIITSGKSSPTEYNSGSIIRLTPQPAENWNFISWTGSVSSTQNPLDITISDSINLTSVFQPIEIDTSNNIFTNNYDQMIDVENFNISNVHFSKTFDQEITSTDWINSIYNSLGINLSGVYLLRYSLSPLNKTLLDVKNLEMIYNRDDGDLLFVRFNDDDSTHFIKQNYSSLSIYYHDIINFSESLFSNYVDLDIDITSGGTIELEKNNNSILISDDLILTVPVNSTLLFNVFEEGDFLFDGFDGVINDRLNLFKTGEIELDENNFLNVFFTEKRVGSKNLVFNPNIISEGLNQNNVNFRSSENFVVLWDNTYDHNHDAKDLLKWYERTFNKTLNSNMWRFPGSQFNLIPIYIRYNSIGQAAYYDQNNSIGYVVHPQYSKTIRSNINIEYSQVQSVHECYHLLQMPSWTNFNTFRSFFVSKYDNNSWYIESTAELIQMVEFLGKNDQFFPMPANYTLTPHLSLWFYAKDDNSHTIPEQFHGYGSSLFLYYLIEKGIIDYDFIHDSFKEMQNNLAMEYLDQEIENLKSHFIQFSQQNIFYDYENDTLNQLLMLWENRYTSGWADPNFNFGDGVPNKKFIDFTVNNKEDFQWGAPEDRLLHSWAYSTSKLTFNVQGNINVNFNGSSKSQNDIDGNYSVRIVKDSNGDKEFYSMNFSSMQFSSIIENIEILNGDILYITVISTPEIYTGDDKFLYELSYNFN